MIYNIFLVVFFLAAVWWTMVNVIRIYGRLDLPAINIIYWALSVSVFIMLKWHTWFFG